MMLLGQDNGKILISNPLNSLSMINLYISCWPIFLLTCLYDSNFKNNFQLSSFLFPQRLMSCIFDCLFSWQGRISFHRIFSSVLPVRPSGRLLRLHASAFRNQSVSFHCSCELSLCHSQPSCSLAGTNWHLSVFLFVEGEAPWLARLIFVTLCKILLYNPTL